MLIVNIRVDVIAFEEMNYSAASNEVSELVSWTNQTIRVGLSISVYNFELIS